MSEWRVMRVSELAVPGGLAGGPFGSSLGSRDYVPAGVPVIRGTNLTTGSRFIGKEFVFVSREKVARDLTRNLALPGDVVFTQRGTLGQVGLVPAGEYDVYVVSQSQMRLRVDPRITTPEFVYYAFSQPKIIDLIHRRAIATGVPHINLGILAEMPLSIPDLHTQRAITDVLCALDDKIAANERTSATAFALAQACYRRLIDQPGVVRTPLGELIDLKYGKALPTRERRAGRVPVYGSGGVTGWHDVPLVAGPGIIVGRKGTVGAVYWSSEPFVPIDTTFYVEPRRPVPLEFTYFALADLGLDQLNSDSAVPGLNRAHALAQSVRVPDPDDLESFATTVRPLFTLRSTLEQESGALRAMRDALLPPLLSGEIRVREADVASRLEPHVTVARTDE